jgi:hypothetical protein
MKGGILKDDAAISPVIGAVLILAISVTVLTTVQLNFVPVWNAELEGQHYEAVYADMMLLGSNIETSSVLGVTKTSDINMGFRYPDRPLLANPKSAVFGKLSASPDLNINITLFQAGGKKTNYSYKVSSLRYEMPGDHAAIVYEYGALIVDYSRFGGRNASSSKNIIVAENDITLPFLMNSGSYSRESSEPIKIILSSLKSSPLEIGGINSVNISMDTKYGDAWRMIFGITYNASADKSCVTSRTTIGNSTNVCVANNNRTILINTTATKEIILPKVGSMVGDRFYAGFSSFKKTVTETSFKGSGEEFMASGVVWNEIPAPGNLTGIVVTNITLDPFINQNELDDDAIIFKVIDLTGHFWMVEIDFGCSNSMRKIIDINLSTFNARSKAKDAYLSTFNNFNNTTRIDLFNQSNYDIALNQGGAYQNSIIESPNALISVLIGDKTKSYYYIEKGQNANQGNGQNANQGNGQYPSSPLVTYRLIIE